MEIPHSAGTVSDGTSYALLNALVNITIIPINDPPLVTDFTKSIDQGNVLYFNVADFTDHYSDVEGSPLIKVKITSLPLNGVLKLSDINVSINDEIASAGLVNLTFTPDANWSGNTNFGWNGYDGSLYALTYATALITVNPVNHLPEVADFTKTTNEDVILNFSPADFTGHYTDPDANTLDRIKTNQPSFKRPS